MKKLGFISIILFLIALLHILSQIEYNQNGKDLKEYLNNMFIKTFISWDKTFGDNENNEAFSIIQTKDGGFAVAGFTWSKENKEDDVWIIKLDKYGNKIWDKTFGGSKFDGAYSIIQTQDEGFAVAGWTSSKGNGWIDCWIIKLDKNGNKIWDKTFGGRYWDEARSIIQTKDGGFAIAGFTSSKGNGKNDAWVIKLDKNGNKIWDKTFGGKNYDRAYSIIQMIDGGFASAGYTYSKKNKSFDAWVIKLDEDGKKIWDKTFGGNSSDAAYSIIQTNNGSFVVAGETRSKGNGYNDFWIIKLDKNGNKVWDRTFGGSSSDVAHSIIQTKDGGFATAGYTGSKGNGKKDIWVIKLDKNGNKVWDRTFGGSSSDEAYSIIQTKDGGFAIAGYTESKENKKYYIWVIKLDKEFIKK
jgi:hypothetical protein